MENYNFIPFIGIGTMGAMALNNIPLDIRNRVFTIFFSREDIRRKVYADLTVQYSCDYKKENFDFVNIKYITSFLKNNKNKVFIAVNLGGDAASTCAIKTVEFLQEIKKQSIIHVSTPFHFQSQVVKQKAEDSIQSLKLFDCEVLVGNNGEILKKCKQDILFSEFMAYRSEIIYDDFRKKFGFERYIFKKPAAVTSVYSRLVWRIESLFRRNFNKL